MEAENLRQFPLFANLPASELNTLVETLQARRFEKGEILLREGGTSQHFYLILEGEVEIVKALGTTDERVLALSGAGSILGEMSMFSRSGAHTASARSSTPVNLLRMTFEEFDAILRRNPTMAYDMLRLYSRRLEDSESLTIQDLREKNAQLTLAYQQLQAAQAAMIEKEKLEHELHLAAETQSSILPDTLPGCPGFDFGAIMIPARQVGGDFYDFIPLGDSRLGVVIGDVCDKGMHAALFMALTYSTIRIEALRQASPGDTLRAVNKHLLQINRSGMFVTLLYGVLDRETGQFCYARAGHPAPLIFDSKSQSLEVPGGLGQPVGLFDPPAIDEQCVLIPPGGTLLVFSDGLSETVDAAGDTCAPLPELCASLLRESGMNAQALCDRLLSVVGGPSPVSLIQDDFTVVAMRNCAAG